MSNVGLAEVVAGEQFNRKNAEWREWGEAELRQNRFDLLFGEDGDANEVAGLRSGSDEDASRRLSGIRGTITLWVSRMLRWDPPSICITWA